MHRNSGDDGVKNHRNARGNDHSYSPGGGYQSRRKIEVVALVLELGQKSRADGCRSRRPASRYGGDEHGSHYRDDRKPSANAPQRRLGESDDAVGYAALSQNIARKDEKGHGDERERIGPGEHRLRDGLDRHRGNGCHQEGRNADRKRYRHAGYEQNQK